MSDFGYFGGSQDLQTVGVTTSGGTSSTLVAPSSTADTKGSWVELVSSLPQDVVGFILSIVPSDPGINSLMDIGIGASGSEQVILANYLIDSSVSSNLTGLHYLYVPLALPAGTRVALRSQEGVSYGFGMSIGFTGVGPTFLSPAGFQICDTYGANTGDSGGTSVDPGASLNTKGAWVQLSASCEDINYLIVSLGGQENSARTACWWAMDIGIGGAGSEIVVVENLIARASGIVDEVKPAVMAFPVNIPAGSRIAVRSQCTINNAVDRIFDVILYGFR